MLRSAAFVLCMLLPPSLAARELLFLGQEYPPLNWSEGGEVKGGMVDVMKEVCKKLNHTCTFRIVPLARAMGMVKEGSADAVMSLLPNAERASYADFLPPVVLLHLSCFVLKGSAQSVLSAQDLNGWTVGAVRASSGLKVASEIKEQVKNLNVVEEVDIQVLLRKLKAGRYGDKGAIIAGDAVVKYEAQKAQMAVSLLLEGEKQGISTAFSKRSVTAQTLTAFTQTLDSMKSSGEVKAILEKHSLTSAP